MCQLSTNSFLRPISSISDFVIPTIRKRKSRLKLWELQPRYHCAALGTCLTLNELRQIAKRARVEDINKWDDYGMHISFVHTLDEKCHVSILVNKTLEKKYKLIIQQFSKTKSENERIDIWNKAVITGDVAGAFWAILTHPNTSEETLFQVYGKIHMLSHLSGATARIDMKEFYKLESLNEKLEEKIKQNNIDNNKKLQKREMLLVDTKEQLSSALAKIKQLELDQQELQFIKKNPFLENLHAQIKQQNTELEDTAENKRRAENSEEKWKQRASREQKEKQQFQEKLNTLAEEKLSVENTLISVLKNQNNVDNCSSCINNNPDLCGRCVLYIGGRNGQYRHFRSLVEQQNGQFIHHDGGREDSYQKLASIVSKADVVLCPLDCVSHNAMNLVKRHCQNNTKQLVYIPHASLSAFSKGLDEVVN